MRLFSVPSGTVNRLTRAWLLTCPFDLAFSTAAAGGYLLAVTPVSRTDPDVTSISRSSPDATPVSNEG